MTLEILKDKFTGNKAIVAKEVFELLKAGNGSKIVAWESGGEFIVISPLDLDKVEETLASRVADAVLDMENLDDVANRLKLIAEGDGEFVE